MPTDLLVIGGFVFDDWSTPERLPFGGRHVHTVHKMPGGARTVDRWGPDDVDRAFTAKFWGADALDDAMTLDRMRVQGAELPYSNGVECRTVIIAEFIPLVVKLPQFIEYSIVLVPTDDSGTGAGGGALGGLGLGGLDELVASDLAAAVALLP